MGYLRRSTGVVSYLAGLLGWRGFITVRLTVCILPQQFIDRAYTSSVFNVQKLIKYHPSSSCSLWIASFESIAWRLGEWTLPSVRMEVSCLPPSLP